MDYNLSINGVYWGYNPLTNHLLSSWDIQVDYLRLAYLKKRIVDIAAPRLEAPPFPSLPPRGWREAGVVRWLYSGNLNGLRVISPIFLQKPTLDWAPIFQNFPVKMLDFTQSIN